MRHLLARVCFAAALVAGLATACGGSGGSPQSTSTASPAGGRSTSVSVTASSTAATATATSTPQPDPAEEKQAVTDAALAELHARHVSPLTRDACLQDNPDREPCVELQSTPEALSRGLARFSGGDPDGGPFTFLMGRTAAGEWHFWLGTRQVTYLLDALPGPLLACGAADVAVRENPSADAPTAATLEKLEQMTADRFVLTSAGIYGTNGTRGEGWYHIVSPAAGWVNAVETTSASLGDCLLHDQIESSPHG